MSYPFSPKQPGSPSSELPARLSSPPLCSPPPPRFLVALDEPGGAGECKARMAPRLPGKSWEASGRRGEAPGRGAGRPSQRASAPAVPHWSGYGEGGGEGGGAVLTSLRAVPARGGGAGSRSETREATHCQEPPHRGHRARLPRLSAGRPPGQGCLQSAGAGHEPGSAPAEGQPSCCPRRRPTPAAASRGPGPLPGQ